MSPAEILEDCDISTPPSIFANKDVRSSSQLLIESRAVKNGSCGEFEERDTVRVADDSSNRAGSPLPVREPIAICGMAIRLPGSIRSPSQFWDLLINGRDARGHMTESRMQSPGLHDPNFPSMGYYLDENLSHFDPSLFKLSRAELEQADPQQRQLLEVTRECLESAGEVNFRGRNIGCYVGTFGDDWMQLLSKDDQLVGGVDFRGTIDAMLANRLSYDFDFKGPSMVIKTGCSSSLVCLHEAARALHFRDCDAAIVAGCNLLMGTTLTDSLTQHGVLSPDGSSKTFDASANGYARSEAINCVYIKRLSDAIRDGNPIRAIVRGTGTNNDGESHGITMPNGAAHEALMRKVYSDCGLDPAETAYVECHGTGTMVGDRIETTAVVNIFGQHGISLGSVKPNIGHSEGASGLTSLIKAVLILEEGTIPPQIKLKTPNPNIPQLGKCLHVASKPEQLPSDRERRISVNSFGIGGSNAHAIVESWPKDALALGKTCTLFPRLLLFSAGTQAALQNYVTAHEEYFARHPNRLDDLSYTLACRREKLSYRAFAVVQPDGNTFTVSNIVKRPPNRHPIVMVFSGQGANWPGMAQELIKSDPRFRQDLQDMDYVLQSLPHAPLWCIKDELRKGGDASMLQHAEYSQPLCTAVQIALANIYKRMGVFPDAVIGHSSGEIAAAYACGGISMRDAVIAAYYRGTVSASYKARGAMAAIGLGKDAIARFLIGRDVTIACENSPCSITISGDEQEIEKVMDVIRTQEPEVFIRRLRIGVAYHTHHMQTVSKHYMDLMQATMTKRPSAVELRAPMFSTTINTRIDSSWHLTPSYWCTNLTSPVQFYSAVRKVLQQFPEALFLEIGPHSTLAGPIKQTCVQIGSSMRYVPTLIRNVSAQSTVLSAVGQLYQLNVAVDYTQVVPSGRVLPDLPSYPWDRAQFGVESRMLNDCRLAYHARHPLLGQRVAGTTSLEPSWRVMLFLDDEPWIRHHLFDGDVVFPLAGYMALATEACKQMTGGNDQGFSLRHVIAHTAMVIRGPTIEIVTTLRRVRLSDKVTTDRWEFNISSYSGTAWVQHCHGEVKAVPEHATQAKAPSPLEESLSPSWWYSRMERVGVAWGPEFQRLSDILYSRADSKASSRIRSGGIREVSSGIHPCVLDQAFQLVLVAWNRGLTRPQHLCIPTVVEEVYLVTSNEDLAATAWAAEANDNNEVECHNENGRLTIKVRNIHLAAVNNTDRASISDKHAAASLHWYPDIEFASHTELFDPVRSGTHDDALLEEMAMLCLIDTWHISQYLAPAMPHMEIYRNWLESQIFDMCSGQHATMGIYAPFLQLTARQRADEIDRRFNDLSEKPSMAAFATGIKRTKENVVKLFTGETTMLDLLTHDGTLADFYTAMSFNGAKYITAYSHVQPSIRILEVGAGTGASTELILRALSAKSPPSSPPYGSYLFTDVSAGFFPKAKERFSDWHDLDYRVLDISDDPVAQGFEAASFDLIVAANVIHATPSLNSTLKNLHTLLSPGGRLVFSELNTRSRIPGYVFGWFPGWWLGVNDRREAEPFVSLERWHEELTDVGFTFEMSAMDKEYPHQLTALIVAQKKLGHVEDVGRSPCVTILCEDAHRGITQALIRGLQSTGIHVSVATLGDDLSGIENVIATLDMERPMFGNLTGPTLARFQKTMKSVVTKSFLWVMPPVQRSCKDPYVAASLGMIRTARLELGLPIATLEIEHDEPSLIDLVISTWSKVSDPDVPSQQPPELEYIVDESVVKIGRYRPFNLETESARKRSSRAPNPGILALEVEQPGLLESVRWVERGTLVAPIAPDEVEIDTRAVGINFHDLAMAMGIISHNVGDVQLGLEFSGIIRCVGSSVHNMDPGDRVFGVACGGMFASRVRISSSLVAKIPDELSFEDAATMGNYSTVILSMVTIGRMEAEQSILIHSACGGVGHTALQLCKAIGIGAGSIYATVGTSSKAEHLMQTYGIPSENIFTSRDASFKDALMRVTGGKGVDLVLNSLSGELLHASWECVAEFGTMIELGRRDLADFGKLSLQPFLTNRTYSCVDMHHFIEKAPHKVTGLLASILKLYQEGKIAPIRPIKVYDAVEAHLALRRLQQSDHMGKVVVRIPQDVFSIPHLPWTPSLRFDPEGSYLLVGGLGGLGRVITMWMARNGAQELVILSRSAGTDSRHNQAVDELAKLGCSAHVVAGSVEDLGDVVRALRMPTKPIKGVIHLAMVLRDAPLVDMTFEEWEEVQGPKVRGAWVLHEALHDHNLDFFVLASSLITVDVMPGQSNYCAANTWLEGFCQYRRSLGLPVSALSIGAVEGAGFVSEHAHAEKNMRARNTLFLSPEALMDYLELAILCSWPDAAADDARPWEKNGHIIMGLKPDPLRQRQDRRLEYYFNRLSEGKTKEMFSGDRLQTLLYQIQQTPALLDDESSVTLLAEEIGRRIFSFLLKPEDEAHPGLAIADIGLDSLVSIELRRWWKQSFSLDTSTLEIMGAGTLRGLGQLAADGLRSRFGSVGKEKEVSCT